MLFLSTDAILLKLKIMKNEIEKKFKYTTFIIFHHHFIRQRKVKARYQL